jgi:hypothetical protein
VSGGGSSAGSDRDWTGYDECGPCGRGGRAYRAHGACVDERTLLHQERVAFSEPSFDGFAALANGVEPGGGWGGRGGGGERPLLGAMGDCESYQGSSTCSRTTFGASICEGVARACNNAYMRGAFFELRALTCLRRRGIQMPAHTPQTRAYTTGFQYYIYI